MSFEINWVMVSLSFAAALIFFHLYQIIIAHIRRKKAERKVGLYQNRLQKMISILKPSVKKEKEE